MQNSLLYIITENFAVTDITLMYQKSIKGTKFLRNFFYTKMARKRFRRYYRRKGRWSPNIKGINVGLDLPANASFFQNIPLCENPFQTENTVSQQYTAKNIEFSFEFDSTNNQEQYIEQLQGYIMFIPQGYTITETIPFTHPEWIMAYKYYGSAQPDTPNIPVYKITTRMSRRLQTGDSLQFIAIGTNQNTQNTSRLNIKGLVRWWTKAN